MSRRDQIRMTDEERGKFLADAQTIIINSIGPGGVPHPMPMWFGIEEDGCVVMTTFTKSQKIRKIERDPRVSMLVEGGTVYNELRGVVIYGYGATHGMAAAVERLDPGPLLGLRELSEMQGHAVIKRQLAQPRPR